ncbi:MAG: XRE family transcriptional regulator [Marinifilaceae bacterium]
MDTTINQRIGMIVEYSGLSLNKFASKIGITQPSLRDCVKGTSEPKFSTIEKIVIAEPIISIDWLITGEGNMLITSNPVVDDCDIAISNPTGDNINIPIYNAEASAGFGISKLDTESMVGTLSVPYAKKGDVVITATGNSMMPIINSGDLLVLRERHNWFEYVELGEIYVVVTEDDVLVKTIYNESDGRFVLRSANGEYNDFTVPKTIVRKVYRVVGTVTQRSIK